MLLYWAVSSPSSMKAHLSMPLSPVPQLTGVGRITAVVFGCMWAFVGAILQMAAQDITMMCIGRIVAGFGARAIDCAIPVWSTEV